LAYVTAIQRRARGGCFQSYAARLSPNRCPRPALAATCKRRWQPRPPLPREHGVGLVNGFGPFWMRGLHAVKPLPPGGCNSARSRLQRFLSFPSTTVSGDGAFGRFQWRSPSPPIAEPRSKTVGRQPPGVNVYNFLEGDPQVACTSPFGTSTTPTLCHFRHRTNLFRPFWIFHLDRRLVLRGLIPIPVVYKNGFSHQITTIGSASILPTPSACTFLPGISITPSVLRLSRMTRERQLSKSLPPETWSDLGRAPVIDTVCGFS